MSFAYPLVLALTLAMVPMLWLKHKRQAALGHSHVGVHSALRSMTLVGWIPSLVFALAWTALCVALARPLLPEIKEKQVIQTRDFVVVTDISGSMSKTISDP